jgi:hypothetical protein
VRSRRAVLALVVTVAGLLAACGAPSADAPVPAPPAPDPLISAVTMTRSWGSAGMDVAGSASIDTATAAVQGHGDIGLDKPIGLVDWSLPSETLTELVTDQAVFRRVGTGLWERTSLADGTDTSPLVDPLRGLAGATVLSSSDRADGGTTITATLPFDAAAARSLAVPPQARDELLARAPEGTAMSLRVEVDPHHRITRIERAVDVDGATARTTVDLSDFAVVLGVAPPPSSSVRP